MMKDEPREQYKTVEKLELQHLETAPAQKFKKITCPSCSEEIASQDINLQKGVSKCSNCNVIFSVEEEIENVKIKNKIKQETLRPEGIDLFYYGKELDITVQQHIQGFDAWAVVMIPLIAATSILLYFIEENPISPYFPIIFSAAAIYYLYKAYNYSKNKTYIEINNDFLSIKYRPKNFKKDKKYPSDEIDQLYLKPSADGFGYITIFMILNGLEGQKHRKLMTVKTLSKAKYLEQEIERYLNLKDRDVPEATI